jgi:hypothetical protein
MAPTRDPFDDTTALLLELVERGFRFVHPHDASGDLIAVHGVRVHHGVVDAVVLRAEDDAHAVRMPGDEPDILRPRTTLWETTGRAQTVLTELLDLPDEQASPDVVAAGCWVPTRPGRAVWLRPITA